MIVYYQKSTGGILGKFSDKSKAHMEKQAMEEELDSMWPLHEGDIGFSKCSDEVKVELGGTWDPKKKVMSVPRPTAKQDHPQKARIQELRLKVKARTADLAEVCELLDILETGKRQAGE